MAFDFVKMRPLLVLIPISCFIFSAADLSCTKRRLVVKARLVGSSATVMLFERLAEKYAQARRTLGVDVDLEFQKISGWNSVSDVDNNFLFQVPAQFAWAENNEFVFPILIRALVMVINLPNVQFLDMPLDVVANIYKGNITTWDHPDIRRYNPTVQLPSQKILALARQEDYDASTVLFTSMLSRMDDEWAQKFGIVTSPNFVNGTCCESRTWKNVISFFAQDMIGVVGTVISIPYTIGYASRPEMEPYNVTKVTLLTNGPLKTVVVPTVESLQTPMSDYVNATPDMFLTNNGTIAITRVNMDSVGAYPLAAPSYATVKLSYRSKEVNDCCLVREMVGFLESALLPSDPTIFLNAFYVPVPPVMADLIVRNFLKRIKCDDQDMYQAYLNSKQDATGSAISAPLSTAEIIFIAVSTFLLLVSGILGVAYLFARIRKRRANANLYLISIDRLKLAPLVSGGTSPGTIRKEKSEDLVSFTESKKAQHPALSREMIFLKNTFLAGDLDENNKVNLAELPPAPSRKPGHNGKVQSVTQWSEKTRALATKLRKSSSAHRNLAAFLGVVELEDGKIYTIFEYCSKGTLHYNLATCRYRLTDSIRRYLAVDVASGLAYLHTRVGAVHGQLNSLTCFLDMAWTVKITLWDQTALHHSEVLHYGSAGEMAFCSRDCRWRCGKDDVKRLIFGDAGSETLLRLIYLDPQLPTVYPQSAVDVYSFGMLLAEIFSGKMPYHEELLGGNGGNHANEAAVTPDLVNKLANAYLSMLEKKFGDPTSVCLPSMPKSTPKYVLNIIEASMRPDPTKRPTMKTILRHLSVSASDVNKGGLVDAMMETMDTYAEQLEEKVEERTAELKEVTTRMRDLLNEVLPPQIAERLFRGEAVPPEYFECVTIYFSDIVGFTIISARSTPIQVMSFLNDLWLMFDSIIQDFDVYKVDTIGDAYMVCSGLPNRNGTEHSRQIARLSIALLEACRRFKVAHLPDEKLHIRIGLNSGPVTAGVVGRKMPQYCVFGDTVNTAARMESTSLPGRIQISTSTYMLLVENFPGEFAYEYRGEIAVKGKGNMLTYWLISGEEAMKRSRHSALSTSL